MTDYWTTTKSPVDMFKRKYETPEAEAYLRENYFIDAAQLAADLKMPVAQVEAYQRRLGLRGFSKVNG